MGKNLVLNDILHQHENQKHYQPKTSGWILISSSSSLWYLPVTYSEGVVETMNKIYWINGL